MAKLIFKYGTMASGKSLELIKTADNYERLNKRVMVLTSSLNTRDGGDVVRSRVGLSRKAMPISPKDDLIQFIVTALSTTTFVDGEAVWPDCILVDEAQFLTRQQVIDLATIVDTRNIPVICFGLKVDFQGKLFTGSEVLLALADKLEEMKTICLWCGHKATMNLRTDDGKPVYDGRQIQIGDSEYLSVCRYHYLNPQIN